MVKSIRQNKSRENKIGIDKFEVELELIKWN